ncbi:MAG: hypothetical protein HFE68_00475 [Erysipelotrichaceae bacterium]|nr:hypothetical protein [Erysipelotrichaceae bacterium]
MSTKRLWLCAILCMLVGCSTSAPVQDTPQRIQLLSPQGAPALATLNLQAHGDVRYVSGSDVLSVELAKPDGVYDVILAPVNLGAKIMESGQCAYRLEAIITWGNLYAVASDSYQSGDPFAAFGENAVPGMILRHSKISDSITYYNSAQDVQAQLLSGQYAAGLLAEPALSATIAKAKEQGMNLSILADLQEELTMGDRKGYPQAAVFVKVGSETKSTAALNAMKHLLNESDTSEDQRIAWIEEIGVDELGVGNAKLAVASWERQNLHYVEAADVTAEISAFLAMFDIAFKTSMLME